MNVNGLAALLLAAAVGSGVSTAQTPAPEARSAKTGTIRGRITAADTGKPLRRARVLVMPAKQDGYTRPMQASTNSRGEFELKDVVEGSYYVTGTRPGFVSVEHGQRRPLERGLAVVVRAGQATDRVDIPLPRAGVLSGRITDEVGEPYPGVRIEALRLAYRHGKKETAIAGFSTTDDRGRFRLSGLQPGSYYVVATSSETWRNEKKEVLGFPSTYYPGTAADQAQAISLGLSEQRTDVNISLQSERAARISGRVVRESGEPAAAAGVTLAYGYPGVTISAGMRSVRASADGSFTIAEVPGGLYRVTSGGDDVVLNVRGADVDGIVLTHRTGSSVSGTIVTDEGTPPPFPVSGVRVMIETSSEDVLPTVRVMQVKDDWSFRMQGLGGPFLFRLTGLPDEWTLATGTLDGRDITDAPFDVPTGGKELTGARLVVTRKVARVEGTVRDDNGRPTSAASVLVFADDGKHWIPYSRYVHVARPDADGRFTITHLPPGTYRAAALEFIEQGQHEDAAFLTELRDTAALVTVSEGGVHTIMLNRRK
jgi:protocatechuate 3,4-dioxygenase beta subunit